MEGTWESIIESRDHFAASLTGSTSEWILSDTNAAVFFQEFVHMSKLLRVVIAIAVTTGWVAWGRTYAADPAGIGRVNLTLPQYQTAVKEMQARDYRPASLSVYRLK